MTEINNKNIAPIINRIEDLINKSSNIPHREIIKLMVKAESNPKFDVKKELENILKADNKL